MNHMNVRGLVLISLLGACGGLSVITTNLFHALIPLPGFGGVATIPLGAACLLIAREKVPYRWSATLTKLVQQVVILLLPGGPVWAHHPLFVPLMLLDGVIIDAAALRNPGKSWTRRPARSVSIVAVSGAVSVAVQGGFTYLVLGPAAGLLAQGVLFFTLVFVGFHTILRAAGAGLGLWLLRVIPQRGV